MDQLAAIFEVQWRIFLNSIRTSTDRLVLIINIFAYLMLLVIDLTISVVLGFGVYYLYHTNNVNLFPLLIGLFTGGMLYWQIGPLLLSSFGGFTINLNNLRLFPISKDKLFLLNLCSGFIDPIALSMYLPLLGMLIGLAVASLITLPWAFLAITLFISFNVLLSRYIQRFFELLLSTRRSKELLGFLFFLFFLSFYALSQVWVNRDINKDTIPSQSRPAAPSSKDAHQPLPDKTLTRASDNDYFEAEKQGLVRIISYFNWLPSGMCARQFLPTQRTTISERSSALALMMLLTLGVLVLNYRRFDKEYKGQKLFMTMLMERLSGRGVAAASQLQKGVSQTDQAGRAEQGSGFWFGDTVWAAILEKELRYLYRSSRGLLTFISSIVISLVVFVPLMREVKPHSLIDIYSLPIINAYALILFSQFFNNSFGFDGHGVKLYMLTPVCGRDIFIAKNLVVAIVVALQNILTILLLHFLLRPIVFESLIHNTFIITIGLLARLSCGNFLSLFYPTKIDFSRFQNRNVSKLSMILSLATQGLIFFMVSLAPFLGWLMSSTIVCYVAYIVELILIFIGYWLLLDKAGKVLESLDITKFEKLF